MIEVIIKNKYNKVVDIVEVCKWNEAFEYADEFLDWPSLLVKDYEVIIRKI